jgi:NTP pyrophosphatase (non-canonical NTP hydrolase)
MAKAGTVTSRERLIEIGFQRIEYTDQPKSPVFYTLQLDKLFIEISENYRKGQWVRGVRDFQEYDLTDDDERVKFIHWVKIHTDKDIEQTIEDRREYVLRETKEVVEAVKNIKEEVQEEDRDNKMRIYLDSLVLNNLLDQEIADTAVDLWQTFKEVIGDLKSCSAGPMPNRKLSVSLDDNNNKMGFEFLPNGLISVQFIERNSNLRYDKQFEDSSEILKDEKILEFLIRFRK